MATAEINITAGQVYRLREDLNENLAGSTDVELVEYALQNNEILEAMNDDDEVVDFMQRAGEAQDRLERAAAKRRETLAKPVEKEWSKEEYEANCRRQLVATLRRNDCPVAADAIEGVERDGKPVPGYIAVDAVKKALTGGLVERWDRAGWAIFYKEIEPRANTEAESNVLFFLNWLLKSFAIIAYNAKVSEDDLESAELALQKSKPSDEWANWAFKALGRLMAASSENAVNALFRKDAELRQTCPTPVAFVDYLRKEIKDGIVAHRAENAQHKLDKRKAQLENRANRAAACQAMRGSNASAKSSGNGKKSKRAAHDPHRNGK